MIILAEHNAGKEIYLNYMVKYCVRDELPRKLITNMLENVGGSRKRSAD